jgi:putative inorganic carbon (HCO3(-)) transporter
MSELTAASTIPVPRDFLSRAIFLAVIGSVSLTVVSIAAAQILLAMSILAAVLLWRRSGFGIFHWPPFAWPLLAFCLWTLVTILLSPGVYPAVLELKKFFLYTLIILVPLAVRGKGAVVWVYRAIFGISVLSCLRGILQYIANPHRGLLDRISGFMSVWMTYSGLLMLTLVALAAFTICLGWRKHAWTIPLALLLLAPLLLSETRNAWAGAIAGILVVVLLLRPKAVVSLLLLILMVYFLAPVNLKQRLQTSFDLADPNTRNRIELWETALRLIRDNPWVGVGPKMVGREALRYRGSHDYPDWMYQHMHNDFLQIAAERGIPGLMLWLWFMGSLAWEAFGVFRAAGGLANARRQQDTEALFAATAALGAWAALLVAGMLEYNFGDSEMLMLFLFLMTAPSCCRVRDGSAQTAAA